MERISRKTFFIRMLLLIVADLTLFSIFKEDISSGESSGFLLLFAPLVLIKLLQIVLRLHDINKSGWFSLFIFIPIVNVLLLSLFFIDGTKGTNKYGKDPKGRVEEKKILKVGKVVRESKDNHDSKTIDEKLIILQESLDEGLLTEMEFKEKEKSLINEKEKFAHKVDNEKTFNTKKEKLKVLLNKNLISEADFNNKINLLLREFEIEGIEDNDIDKSTKLFYLQRGTQQGPISAQELIKLLNTKKITPNCLVRTEKESTYSKRASQILDIVENKTAS